MLVEVPEEELPRVLDQGRRLPYRCRRGERKTAIHWGQRKLLLSEIEFLSQFPDADTVVYAGAAPGTHTPLLASLFPAKRFVLVDPAEFSCSASARVEIRRQFFTNAIATEFRAGKGAGGGVLFVSDVRSADWRVMSPDAVAAAIAEDMAAQRRWHELMRPVASMLKFRLPWTQERYTYLDGEVRLPIWGPQTTSEARLVCLGGCGEREWDCRAYCEAMFRFNVVTRLGATPHGLEGVEGLCRCYDCAAEVAVLRRHDPDADVARLVQQITLACANGSGRTLRSGHISDDVRRNWFKRRRYDAAAGRIHELPDEVVVSGSGSGSGSGSAPAPEEEGARLVDSVSGTVFASADEVTCSWRQVAEPTLADVPGSLPAAGVLGLGTAVPQGCVGWAWATRLARELLDGAAPEERLFPPAQVEGSLPADVRVAPCPAGEPVLLLCCRDSLVAYALHWDAAEECVGVTRIPAPLEPPGGDAFALREAWLAPCVRGDGVALVLREGPPPPECRDARAAQVAGITVVEQVCASTPSSPVPSVPYEVEGVLLAAPSSSALLWAPSLRACGLEPAAR